MVKITLYLLLALLVLGFAAGQFGLLSGSAPADLGVKDARLKAPSTTPNSVSSQAELHPTHPQSAYAAIEALPFQRGDAGASMQALVVALKTLPGVTVVEQKPDYVRAQAQTRWLKFVDDMEFWANPDKGVVELRSASRIGRKDFGVNRQRIEALRQAYQTQP